MRKWPVWGALVVASAVGCSSPSPDSSGERTQSTASPIQGGMNDTTHTFAVGVLVNINPSQGEVAFCSGALLAPNLVATARHCAANISSTTIDCTSATFGADFATSEILVTTDATMPMTAAGYLKVAKVVTPNPTAVCGDDLALLILQSNVQLAQYVTPVLDPPMSDHSVYSTKVTAIGYGVDAPTDTTGATAGVRRIREDISLQCVPNDSTFPNCLASYQGQLSANEFYSGDGTCEGDSGSSAYDQASFDAGNWVSFGVLSRGGVSADGQSCQGGIYTRFDAWAQLIQTTALQAASMGGYTAPPWATSGDGGIDAGAEASTGKSDGTSCSADAECASQNCVSIDGKNFVCADPCGANGSCAAGFSCQPPPPKTGGFCFPNASSASSKASCAVGAVLDDPQPVPWRAVAVALGVGVAVLTARRRRRA